VGNDKGKGTLFYVLNTKYIAKNVHVPATRIPFALSGLTTIFSICRGLHPLLYTACPSGIKGNIPVFRKAKQLPFLKYETDTKYFR
jgi:hypothetical protein